MLNFLVQVGALFFANQMGALCCTFEDCFYVVRRN